MVFVVCGEKIDIVIFRDNGTDCINRIRQVLGEALCIYCTDRASELSCQELEQLHDIWPEKLVPATAKLLFTRLMDNEKLKKDAWLWNTELEAVIDTSLDLIWFKGRFGEHWRVNNAFCDTVKKTKEDIRGKQHYYIWDLTPEEYDDGAAAQAGSGKKDRRQRADCRCAKTAQCFLRSAHRAVFVCAGCHDVQCVFCEILEKNKSFLQKTLDNSRLDWYTK